MNKRIRVAIIFGGRSAEHEVSLQSAKNIVSALDKQKYEPILIGIDKTGKWLLPSGSNYLLNETDPKLISLNSSNKEVALATGRISDQLIKISDFSDSNSIDVVFPVLHGPYGEDGTIQGLLKLTNLPFVGAGVLGSAIGMDKDVMKRLLKESEIPVSNFLVFRKGEKIIFEDIKNKLGLPLFIKPANLGSSFGVTKVKNKNDFNKALKNAFLFDNKILVEETIEGREIEVSVLGNENPIASLPGEIKPKDEFYTYRAKYTPEFLEVELPVKLKPNLTKKFQKLAIQIFHILCCEGMARVDFFLKKNEEILVNELNTIPGFTSQSVYPKLWEASGISQTQLIDKLIELAIERFKKEKRLKTSK